MTSSLSGSGFLSPDSFSLIHSREATDSSESYSSFEDPSSEDEIVWSLSENDNDIDSGDESQSPVFIRSQGAFSPATFSDDDIVVLSRPGTVTARYQSLAAPGSVEALANTLSNLNVNPRRPNLKPKNAAPTSPKSPRRKKRKAPGPAKTASTFASTSNQSPPKAPGKRGKKVQAEPAVPVAARAAAKDDVRIVVDDVSEVGEPSAYEEAVQYVSEVLANPAPAANSNLKLLHALIIELGLAPTTQIDSLGTAVEVLPRSLRAARALLKSQVFLNVVDYLAVRSKGLDALRSVMHPSRSALTQSIRSERKKMPAKEVKKSGLGVLLVTCYR
ncbi:hypothetical protein EIP91_002701 [Steccherinum ochraceum]|uniref:Uncharacterized protein n=1 Tax=Steccherinum ochraceum TaxID=92696 RepID=A0A4R0RDH2_9APHY|nr:hypothetical protein EIP91_002701 [Steccherinum ochraceum]